MDPEPLDQYGEYGHLQQRQQMLPEEFTQSDALRLQQYNAGLSAAQKQMDDGEITREDGEVLKQGILRLRLPLLQRQQAQGELIKQRSVQEIEEVGAQAQGMQQADARFRANGFRERLVPVTEPMSGNVAWFYESEPNKWTQADFTPSQEQTGYAESGPGGAARRQGMGLGGPEAVYPGDRQGGYPAGAFYDIRPDTGGSPGAVKDTFVPPGVPGGLAATPRMDVAPGEGRGDTANQVDQRTLTANPETGGHTLEIWNGPNRELVHFDANRQIVGREAFDAAGNPVMPDQQLQSDMGDLEPLSPAQDRFLGNLAEHQFPPVDQRNYPNNTQGQLAYANDVQQRTRDVALTKASLVRSHQIDRRQKRANEMIQQRHMEEQRLKDERTKVETAQKEQALAEKERLGKEEKTKESYQKRLERHVDHLLTDERWKGKTHTERVTEAKAMLKEEGYDNPFVKKGPTPEQQKAQVEAMQKLHAMTGGFGGSPTPAPPTQTTPSPGATQTGPRTEKVHVPHGGHLLGLGERPLGSENPSGVTPDRVKQLLQAVQDRRGRAYFGYGFTREGNSLHHLESLLRKADKAGQFTEADKQRYTKLLEDLGKLDIRGQLNLE